MSIQFTEFWEDCIMHSTEDQKESFPTCIVKFIRLHKFSDRFLFDHVKLDG